MSVNYLERLKKFKGNAFAILKLRSYCNIYPWNSSTEDINAMGMAVEEKNYKAVFMEEMGQGVYATTLPQIFLKSRDVAGNIGISINPSDIIAIKRDNAILCYFVNPSFDLHTLLNFDLAKVEYTGKTGGYLTEYKQVLETVSELWTSFESAKVDDVSNCLAEDWNGFESGTPCEQVYRWFWHCYHDYIVYPASGKICWLDNSKLTEAHKFWDNICTVDSDLVCSTVYPLASDLYEVKSKRRMYFVFTTYSFDPDVEAKAFPSEKEAWSYIEDSIKTEQMESESLGRKTDVQKFETGVNLIDHFWDHDDTTTFTVANIGCDEIGNVLETIKNRKGEKS